VNELRTWFAGRSLRERRLLLVMAGLAAVTLLWATIILPVRNGLSSSRERYTDAVVRLGAAEAGLAQVKAIQRRRPQPLGAPLLDAIRQRGDAAGLAFSSLEVQGPGRVRAAIATAKAGALMGWIGAMEADGVLVDSLTVSGNGDGTVAAQMTLMGREG
jgi:general secretion pathway protein M